MQKKDSIRFPVQERIRKPEWLKVKLPSGKNYVDLKKLVLKNTLNTVCEDARCPNIAECWERKTATFMILGDVCTRSCGFCSVKTGKPELLDWGEPDRVANAVLKLELNHAVITSVNRDELENGGAEIYALTIKKIKEKNPHCKIEVLIPDFCGNWDALQIVLDAKPDILNHNIETVPRLYKLVRPQAKYERTLELLKISKVQNLTTKSGFMVGLGEREDEVYDVMYDLRKVGCDILTIGQYLQPTKNHLPVKRYVTPETFIEYKKMGLEIGFKHVESGALVRSSYHADKHFTNKEL
ncbi:MAG: lipoyl synthase [Ignavibacteria bacterium RBG_16_35_7]|nr:MAG: lipoyl synthase [Ignavibacteria bacterium RBG_16_35_7]